MSLLHPSSWSRVGSWWSALCLWWRHWTDRCRWCPCLRRKRGSQIKCRSMESSSVPPPVILSSPGSRVTSANNSIFRDCLEGYRDKCACFISYSSPAYFHNGSHLHWRCAHPRRWSCRQRPVRPSFTFPQAEGHEDTQKASRSLSQSFLIWGRYFVFLVAHWLEISGIGDVLYTFLHFFYTSMALILWYVLFDITLIIPCITVLPTNAQTGTTLTLKQT